MNYLAHAYLSFREPEILVGNMISDFVKGKKKFEFSEQIQKGILLHRAIDEYTDSHAETKLAKQFFRPAYRLYAGSFIDVVFDHFLATDKNEFSGKNELKEFSEFVYKVLRGHHTVLPDGLKKMLPYMESQDWLGNYQFKWGLEKSFGGLVHRAKYLRECDIAVTIFNEHYEELKKYYGNFFPGLKNFAAEMLSNLLHD